jgi:hypothetical protein
MRIAATTAVLIAALSACSSSGSAPEPSTSAASTVYAYSLVAPLSVSPSGLVARAVLPKGSTCPDLEVGGGSPVQMDQRRAGTTTKGAFDDALVCSANIPAGATSASVAGIAIPAAMPKEAQTIASFADTGCRIKGAVQDCNSTTAWPLKPLAEQIAKAQPDLIIHVGDYFYRELPCPAKDTKRCGGSPVPPTGVPFEDSAAGWEADFFSPAQAVFGVAPILAARGNHEVCSKGGNGYYLYMDPRPGTEDLCTPRTRGGELRAPVVIDPTWSVDVPLVTGRNLRLIMVDSANGYDFGISPFSKRLRPEYRAAAKLADDPGVEPWLVTHQPPTAITTTKFNPGNIPDWQNWVADDQAAASYGLLDKYAAMVSGHLHLSQVAKVKGLPPQFVFGGGGTRLDPRTGYTVPKYGPLSTSKGQPLVPGLKPYPADAYRWIEVQHAFGLARPNPSQGAWDVAFVRPTGETLVTCTVQQGTPDCGETLAPR